MKKLIIAFASLMVVVAAHAQGTVNFNNRVLPTIDARVLMPDNSPVGVGFTAQLFGGPSGTPVGQLTALTPTTTFREGAGAGYVNPIVVEVPGVGANAQATLVMRVYQTGGAFGSGTFGESAPITVALGGQPAAGPPVPPSNLDGLVGFNLVPEPSTIALGVLGVAALLLRRRK